MASYICIDELHIHPRDFIHNWSDAILLLGYASLKHAQQSICESCYNKYKTRLQKCYYCEEEFSVNKDGKEEKAVTQPLDIRKLVTGGRGKGNSP